MRYQIDRENYHRFDVSEVNKLPARSYFIPFENRQQAESWGPMEARYHSPKVRCLSGTWDFAFFPRPAELPAVLDTDRMAFDTMDVPSCWQFRGYDRPFYVNSRYQFPYRPPQIPREEPVGTVFHWGGADGNRLPRWSRPREEYNFVGVYRRHFSVDRMEGKRILSFLGVASCLDLYVNGSHVGYSEGSHNTAEFDITPYIHDGENELLAVVRRWCTGSYLECQDMFRSNGIFRDVLLFEQMPTDLWDFAVKTEKTGQTYRLELEAEGGGDLTVTLMDGEKTLACADGRGTLVLEDLKVTPWNGEKPVLYDLYLETPTCCIRQRIGFRTVTIEGDVFRFNGRRIKLHGVNHHDTSCRDGYTLSPQQMEQDIRLCKEHNIDTIRTSHYPPDPMFLELCDQMGIYVVDEADLETHGTVFNRFPPRFGDLTDNEAWAGRYLDRAKRLYGRDKNRTCVTMWSLGNESGGEKNTDAMYRWLKARTALPIHYEGVIHSRRKAYDVGSEMYPSVEKVRLVGLKKRREKPLNDRPYFLCEYAHAMGVGPGAVEEYWQQIYEFDNLMGGCVWEMVDHAVLHPDGSYTYGGDHGEWEHDGNFCVDGLFYPDRTPSTGAKVVAHVYRPIRVRHLGGGNYELFNTMGFTGGEELELSFRFADGRVERPRLDLPPLGKQVISLPGGGEWVTVEVKKGGKLCSREQIPLEAPKFPEIREKTALLQGFSVENGTVKLRKEGKTLTCAAPYTILFRAPTDNDLGLLTAKAFRSFAKEKETHLSTRIREDRVEVTSRITCGRRKFLCRDVYEGCPEGIAVTSTLKCLRGKGDLPRFGKAFRLDERFCWVEYLGRNGESYGDMKDHTQIHRVQCGVPEMTEPNLRPQESGNRCDTRWVRLSDGETDFTFTALEAPFELGVKPYSDRELLAMAHRRDEKTTGTYVTLSAFQMGIGTGSCGPTTRKEYRFDCRKEYTLKFLIR